MVVEYEFFDINIKETKHAEGNTSSLAFKGWCYAPTPEGSTYELSQSFCLQTHDVIHTKRYLLFILIA